MRTQLASLAFFASVLAACGGAEDDVSLSEEDRLALPADPVFGRRVFRQCAVCHEAAQGTGHRQGPNLWNIVGAKAGQHPDFIYSKAMKNADLVWDDATLDAYIADPQGTLPGTRMGYFGSTSEADRRDIIAFLHTLKDDTPQ
ncbi:MAG: cytochrome c family protein, partial [Pseudomonadota bacterium]